MGRISHPRQAAPAGYSKPSLRICEEADRVFPPRNHDELIQLTLSKGTDVVTVIAVPTGADAGSGEMATVTPGTATPAVYSWTAVWTWADVALVVMA